MAALVAASSTQQREQMLHGQSAWHVFFIFKLQNVNVSNSKMYLCQIAKCVCFKLLNEFVSNSNLINVLLNGSYFNPARTNAAWAVSVPALEYNQV